jgi:hypothetical protein
MNRGKRLCRECESRGGQREDEKDGLKTHQMLLSEANEGEDFLSRVSRREKI